MSTAAKYIGSRISLTTKSQIRYEGILFALDHEACSVSVEQVKCLGTEGRNNGIREIAPSATIYEMIVFRASDIIELKIINASSMADPAIMSSSSTPSRSGPGGSNDGISSRASHSTKAPTSSPTAKNTPMVSATPTMSKIGHPTESTKVSNATAHTNNKSTLSSPTDSKGKSIWKITTLAPLLAEESNQKLLSASTSSVAIIDPAPLSKASELKPARTYEPIGQRTEENDNRPFSFSTVTSKPLSTPRPKPPPTATPKVYENKRIPRERKVGFPREFDMDRANRRFENIIAKDGLTESQVQSTGYDSNASFFDSLTATDASSTGDPAKRSSAKKDFRLNVETFGPVAYNSKPSYYKKASAKGHRGTRKYPDKGDGNQRQFQLSSSSST